MIGFLACEACRMKLPSEVHAKAHLIVHGPGHEAVVVVEAEQVAP